MLIVLADRFTWTGLRSDRSDGCVQTSAVCRVQDFTRTDNAEVDDAVREAEAMCSSILVEGIERALSGVRV